MKRSTAITHFEGFAEDANTHITYAATTTPVRDQVTCKSCLKLMEAGKRSTAIIASPKPTREHADLTRPLINALNETGGLALRMNSGKVRVRGGFMQLHEKGTADILFFPRSRQESAKPTLRPLNWFIEHGQPIWIETKNVKKDYHKEQQKAQEEFRIKVEALGHRYIRAMTIDEGLAALK
jgi:hypothetical protein